MIIPIGIQCTIATIKNKLNKTTAFFPFDWVLSNPLFVAEMFRLLFEEKIDIETLVREHFFCIEGGCRIISVEHYCTGGSAPLNKKYDVIFPHDDNSEKTISKYIRRFERLRDTILNSEEELLFIYSSQSSSNRGNFTIDDREVIKDVYVSLTKIYNIISSVRKGKFRMIVLDTILTEDPVLLHPNILLFGLKKSDSFFGIVDQVVEAMK